MFLVIESEDAIDSNYLSGVANGSLDSFLQSLFIAACDIHFGSVAFQRLGDDEAKARATCSKASNLNDHIS